MKGFLAFSVLLFFLFSNSAFADFDKGLKAYFSGDYATALREWKPIADQGNDAIQDYVRAHLFNLTLLNS